MTESPSTNGTDSLADSLRERILAGEFAVGTSLPVQQELIRQTGFGRAKVREALRILEVQGLIRIRSGRAGGALVQRPPRGLVASSVSLVVRGGNIRLAAILQMRESLEPVCAGLAATNRSDEDILTIRAANRPILNPSSSLAEFLQANVDWHIAVAAATGNELITAFMTGLAKAIYASTDNDKFVSTEVRNMTGRIHSSIENAIEQRDAAAAVRRMNRHIHSYATAVAQIEQRVEIPVADAPAERSAL